MKLKKLTKEARDTARMKYLETIDNIAKNEIKALEMKMKIDLMQEELDLLPKLNLKQRTY